MKVNYRNINSEVHTVSDITLISKTTYYGELSNYELTNNKKITVKTYINENLNVLGKLSIIVRYKVNMFTNFLLHVIVRNGLKHLGLNWLSELNLDWAINILQSL